jgi:hypothetical protein
MENLRLTQLGKLLPLFFVFSLLVAACSSGGNEEEEEGLTAVTSTSGIELRLDALFYADGQSLTVVLDFGEVTPPTQVLDVAVAGSVSGDVEAIRLRADGAGRYVSESALPVRALSDTAEPLNEVLSLASNETLVAMYFIDKEEPSLENVEEDWVVDVAFFEDDPASYADVDIEPELAATDDERSPLPGAKPVGTIVPRDGLPVQIATEELIFYPRDAAHLQAFLDESGGSVIASQEFVNENGDLTEQLVYLIAVDPSTAELEYLPQLRGFFGEDADLLASKSDALGIYYLALRYQLEGYVVAVNPRMQYHGAPDIAPAERSDVTHTMRMVGSPSSTTPCMPGDPDNPCVENIPAAWTFNALWDADSRRINVGILDIGFAPNADFRLPASGPWVECDMTASSGFSCGPGAAQGPPTVGNSFFGDKSWHGTGIVTTIGGIVSNDFGASGVGGQVAVPMMYKYDAASYIFEIGAGLRRATDDGASCINVSGGYPCNILTTIGPDFDICTAAGRTGLCTAIAGVLAAAVSTTCAVSGIISFIFPPAALACPAAAVAGAFSTGACFSTLAFGNLASPMSSGVWHAHRAGVPVIASAGNRLRAESLPPVIRDYVNLDNARLEDWQVVPAALGATIAVGAVESDLSNVHFFGDTVDIWAPIRSAYFSPESTDDPGSALMRDTIGGTSAAAPFITGLVAMMQAMDPELDPNAPGVTDAERRTIVDRITTIVTDEANTFSNAELVALGFADEPVERRLLVNPLAVLQATAAGREVSPYQDFASRGYDDSLNYSEVGSSDDSPAQATTLTFGETATGTIATIPGDVPYTPPPDVDWYNFTMPTSANADRAFLTNIAVAFPTDPAADEIFIPAGSASVKLVSRGSSGIVYRAIRPSGGMLSFSLTSNGDNVYKVTVDSPELAVPEVQISNPTSGQTLCAGFLTPLRANVDYAEFPTAMTAGIDIPASEIVWRDGATIIGTGKAIDDSFTAGSHTISVRVFDDPALSDSITRTVQTCVGSPPTATIDNPPLSGNPIDLVVDADQFDASGAYVEITLLATASDPDIDDPLTFSWTTNHGDVQPGGPSSGAQVLSTSEDATIRLYSSCNLAFFGTVDHLITFRATDSQDNSATDTRVIRVLLLC